MPGYTKLFSSIIASTIWRSDNNTRIVWITLLAMSDRRGMVESSVPGLADMARIPVSSCRKALRELESPDPDSRSKEHEGRRILTVDGGWFIINHAKYRAKMSSDDRREYLRQKKAESRKRQHVVNTSQQLSTLSTHTDPAPEADPDPKAERSTHSESASVEPEAFGRFWEAYPKKKSRPEALRAWLNASPDIDVVLAALKWQRLQRQWQEANGRFIPNPAKWLDGAQWDDEPFVAEESPAETVSEARDRILREARANKKPH